MRLRHARIIEFVFLGSILGYPLVAGLSATLGLANREFSIALRLLIGLAAVYLIADGIGSRRGGNNRMLIFLLSLFLMAYLTRIVASTLFEASALLEDPSHYWLWFFSAAVLPAYGLAMGRSHGFDWAACQSRFLAIGVIAALLVLSNVTTYVGTGLDAYDSGRARLDTLNPISLGHLGATLFLVGLAAIMAGLRSGVLAKLLVPLAVVLGLTLMIAANSRGPLVATAAALLFGWLAFRGSRRLVLTLIGVVLILSFVPLLEMFEENFGVTTYSRLIAQPFSQEKTVLIRLAVYGAVFDAALQNVLLGGGLEIAETGTYPHNLTIEAFLATGIVGGTLFLILEVVILISAWRLCQKDPRLIWIGMLVVQYVVASQFSGAIYAANQFWAVIGIVIFMGTVLPSRATARRLSDTLKVNPL